MLVGSGALTALVKGDAMKKGSDVEGADVHVLVPADPAALFAKAAQLMPGLLYIFNHDTQSNEYTNRTIAQFLGYSEAEVRQMGSKLLPTLMHPDDFAKLPDHFERLSKLKKNQQATFEYRTAAKDGSEVWLRSVDTVMERTADGRVIRHVGIATDITAQKLAKAELFNANRALEARVASRTRELQALNDELERRVVARTTELRCAHEELKQLTYIATHDLRVPVNNMSSLASMLDEAREQLDDEHRETLDWMHQVCVQAGEKLDALICAAQAHSGAVENPPMVDFDKVLETVLLNLHFLLRDTQADVRKEIDATHVSMVPKNLEIILQVLIGNALKYQSADRRPRITVQTSHRPGETLIEVKDNGTGIDLERDGGKVFALFQRAHVEPNGAGVALHMVRKIVEKCGGSISVESVQGEGSVFSVLLPCCRSGGMS